MNSIKPIAIAFDAFGTLIRYGDVRHNPYRLLLGGREKRRAALLPFLTRNLSADVIAAELGLTNVMPEFRRELDEELAGLGLFNEVADVFRKLRSAGIRTVVCSNLAFEYGPAVRRLLPHVDNHILSFEVGAAKPDHLIYETTCRVLDCEPGEVVLVGDSKRCDFHGPLSFGMRAQWLNRRTGLTLIDVLEGIL